MPIIALVFAAFVAFLAMLLSFPGRYLSGPTRIVEQSFHSYPASDHSTPKPEALENLQFKPFDGTLMKGNSNRTVILRLLVRDARVPLVLIIQPPYHRFIDVFIQTDSGEFRHYSGGTSNPESPFAIPSVNTTIPLNFEIESGLHAPQSKPFVVYAMVKSESAGISAQVMPLNEALQFDSTLNLTVGLYFGLTVLVTFLSLIIWLATRERLWIDSVVCDLTAFFFTFMQLGILHRYLPSSMIGDWIFKLYVFSLSALCFGIGYFYPRLYREFKAPEALLKPYKIALAMPLISLVLILSNRLDLALGVANALILMMVALTAILFFFIKHESKSLLMMLKGYLIVFNGTALFWLISILLNLPVSKQFALYSLTPSNLFSSIVILLLLGYRTQLKANEKRQIELAEREARAKLELEQQKLEETTGFLSMVIHEVKNPLNYIRLAVRNLKVTMESDSTNNLNRLNHIIDSVTTIDDLLERSLQVDMIEQGNISLYVEKIRLDEALTKYLGEHPDKSRIKFEPCSLPITATVDQEIFRLVMRNLIDNSLKYSPENSTVNCILKNTDAECMVQIRNQVGPMGPPDISRLFKKYYHADQDRFVRGMGLGLYWVRQVLLKMNGRIQYELIDQEIRFTVWLPV